MSQGADLKTTGYAFFRPGIMLMFAGFFLVGFAIGRWSLQ